jgi:hypothetical protein
MLTFMKFAPLALVIFGFLIAGCQPEAPTEPAKAESAAPTTAASADPAEPKKEAEATVKPGMSMADVKKILGAPNETKHEHGPAGSELDFWVYATRTVKFQDGKDVE